MQTKPRFYFYSLFLLLSLLLLGISSGSVLAQEVTPTPTLEPLYKTPTPQPTLDYSCPAGTPVGWGTVTPGPVWSAQCSHCLLTLTPYYTPTPYPLPSAIVGLTQTAVVLTGTPTPTQVVTSTPTVLPGACSPITISLAESFGNMDWARFDGGSVTCTPNGNGGYHCVGDAHWTDTFNWADSHKIFHYFSLAGLNIGDSVEISNGNSYVDASNGEHYDVRIGVYQNTVGTNCSGGYGPEGGTQAAANAVTDCFWSGAPNGPINAIGLPGGCFNVSGVTCTWHYDFVIAAGTDRNCLSGGSESTPTPGLSYCAVVDGTVSSSVDMSGLPNIMLGPAQCISFGPYTIGLSALNWLPGLSGITDISLPQTQICFREIYFGSVNLFGVSINLDLISSVITGILALRWLFRS